MRVAIPPRLSPCGAIAFMMRLASPRSKQPLGTRSNVYKYFDGETSVMVLHCFVLRSGELGASGKMDPKRLLVDGISYYCD
jgi:hypothetical protein